MIAFANFALTGSIWQLRANHDGSIRQSNAMWEVRVGRAVVELTAAAWM
jgi:hypothetical protein